MRPRVAAFVWVALIAPLTLAAPSPLSVPSAGGLLGGSPAAFGLLAVAMSGLVVIALLGIAPAWRAGRTHPALQAHSLSLRLRAGQARYVPSRDPDAAGRPRPRAPSAALRRP